MGAVETYVRNTAEDIGDIKTTINDNGKRLLDMDERALEQGEASKRWRQQVDNNIEQVDSKIQDWRDQAEENAKRKYTTSICLKIAANYIFRRKVG